MAARIKMHRGLFLTLLITLLALISTSYVILHAKFNKGEILKKPSTVDITIINNMPDSAYGDRTKQYLMFKYPLSEEYKVELDHLLHQSTKKEFIQILGETGIRCYSYFWLVGDFSLLEIIFWSLFGALCSHLYYYVQYWRKGLIDKKEYAVYISKLFYTPFIALIIYFTPDIFTDTKVQYGFSYWTLVISFILGFFSGRAVEFLDKIKNLILPTVAPTVAENTADAGEEIPSAVFEEAIRTKRLEWEKLYGGPFESIAVGKKITDGLRMDALCLQFGVKEKAAVGELGKKIPVFIPYTFEGKEYKLPTDVVEVGTISSSGYDSEQPMSLCEPAQPKLLGISCSRILSDTTGTIGLRVRKRDPADNNYYLLGCYHVLCAPELNNSVFQVLHEADTADGDGRIISPGKIDTRQDLQPLATVTEGYLNDEVDIALARLGDPQSLLNKIYRTAFAVSKDKIQIVTEAHAAAGYTVNLVGRTSGKQTGYIQSDRSFPRVTYGGHAIIFDTLIQTSKISENGDSGGPVFDNDGKIIGILVASSPNCSFIIPIKRILDKLKIDIA